MAATVAYHRSADAVLSPPSSQGVVNAAQCTGMGGVTCQNANGSASTALVHKEKRDTKSRSALVSSSASCAMTLLTAVERSMLRTLAFVFYQLDREQAKYCASSILRWYFQVQAQLPMSAVESLERVAASVISLSDAKFTSFWLSLLEKEIESELDDTNDEYIGYSSSSTLESRITIQNYEEDAEEQEQQAKREKTLIWRLYQHIYFSIQGLFFANRSGNTSKSSERGRATQTPCTSPIDLSDDSHYQKAHRRKHNTRLARYEGDDESNDEFLSFHRGDEYTNSYDHDQYSDDDLDDSDNTVDNDDDLFELGWAIEYMEQQESTVSTELTRRMHKMMHSSIPLNLFRVTVAYNSEQSEDAGEGGFMGVISPESFPPTPITRDLQTRRMNCYTVSVLDHATLALRLLEANRSTDSASQQLR